MRLPARPFLSGLFTLCLCLLQAGPPRACSSQEEALGAAQELYQRRADLDQARQAAHKFRLVLAAEPGCRQAGIGLVKVLVWIGVLSSEEPELAAYREAAAQARLLARERPQDALGHYWLGMSLALQANAAGGLQAMSLVRQARQSLETALDLDPGLDQGGPPRVLGRLYFKLPAILGGDYARAERHLRQALALGPRYWLNHLYLAALLLERGRPEEALPLLRGVMAGPAPPGLEPEWRLWRQQAARLVQAWEHP